jgi:hypothetical protein
MYSAPLRTVLFGGRRTSFAVEALRYEAAGLAFDARDMSASVKGHTTNFDGDANGLFTYTSPSTKYVRNAAGLLVPGTTMRCDHDASGNKLGLLIEEQRTNLFLRSADFDNASWTKTNTTVTADQVAAPDGTISADKIEATSTTSEMRQDVVVNSTSATLFAFFKKGNSATGMNVLAIRSQTGGTTLVAASLNLDTGAITYITGSSGAVAINWGNGWWLFYMTATITSGHTIRGSVGNNDSAITSGHFSYIWGAQLEPGSFPTSYIPTAGSQVTRAADAITLATSKFPLGSAWSVMAIGQTPVSASPAALYGLDNASTNEASVLYRQATFRALVRTGAVLTGFNSSAANSSSRTKLAHRVKLDDFILATNGTLTSLDNSGAMPTPTRLALGFWASQDYLNGWLEQLVVVPRAWSDAELQAKTA